MALQKLDVVNQMLGLQGERPINTLESVHPSVAPALLALDTWNSSIQSRRWWFNTERATLTPQLGTGFIRLPNNTLAFDALVRYPHVAVRGEKLYNADTQTYVFTAPVAGWLHRLIDFDDLPMVARAYIAARAKQAFQSSYDADPIKTRDLKEEVQETYVAMNSEHIRIMSVNMFDSPSIQRAIADHGGWTSASVGVRNWR